MESVTPEEFLRLVFRSVGEQRDPQEIFLARKLDCMVEQSGPVSMALKLFMNDQVFEQDHESAFRRADGKEQVDHSNDRAIAPQNEDPSTAGLFENQTKSAQLFVFVGTKITLLLEQSPEHFGQLIQISFGRGFNNNVFAHRLHCLFAEIARTGNLRIQEIEIHGARIDIHLPHPKVTAFNSREPQGPAL
jgi:hypothetical protein